MTFLLCFHVVVPPPSPSFPPASPHTLGTTQSYSRQHRLATSAFGTRALARSCSVSRSSPFADGAGSDFLSRSLTRARPSWLPVWVFQSTLLAWLPCTFCVAGHVFSSGLRQVPNITCNVVCFNPRGSEIISGPFALAISHPRSSTPPLPSPSSFSHSRSSTCSPSFSSCYSFFVRSRACGGGGWPGWSDGKIRSFGPETGRLIYVINDAHKKSARRVR